MPFDGRNPSNAVEILSRMEDAFRSGEWKWGQEGEDGATGNQCLVTGTRQARPDACRQEEVEDLLYRAIPGRKSANRWSAIVGYNDRKGRTLEDILAVIRKAKLLALAAAELP